MSQRVHELAKDLNMSNKDLLDRINGMGIEVKTHMSVLEDIDVVAVTNTVKNSKKSSETKIVKVAAKKAENKDDGEVKVTIKPAAKSVIQAQEKTQHKPQAQPVRENERPYRTPPQGKPMPKTVMAPNGKVLPQGKPMPKNAVPQTKSSPEDAAEKQEQKIVENMPRQETTKSLITAEQKEAAAAEAAGKPEQKPAERQEMSVEKMADTKTETETTKTAQLKAGEPERTVKNDRDSAEQPRPATVREHPQQRRDNGEQGQRRDPNHNQQSGPRREGAAPHRESAQGATQRRDGQNTGQRRDGQGYGQRRDSSAPGQRNSSYQGGSAGQRSSGGQGGAPGQRSSGGQGGAPGQRNSGSQGGAPGQRYSGQGGAPGQRNTGGQSGAPGQRNSGGPRRDNASNGQRNTGGQQGGYRKDGPSAGRGAAPGGQNRGSSPAKKDFSKPTPEAFGKPSSHKKQNEKKRDRPYSKPMDLTKAAPKKHRKNKPEKVTDQVQENMIELETLPVGTKIVNVPITVKGLSEQIEKTTSQVIMALMRMGIMANVNQNIDEETAVLLGEELGVNIMVDKVAEEIVEEGLELFEDKESELHGRPPIITVMGHVDHGKTSLLDAIRKTNVTDREAGGITQHIGASEVVLNGQKIVFLDTPGHEAFTAMRARGAHATDIAVLVVAADDSVKPQTIESISHAKAAGVPIIVAINKIDKPGANPDRVKQDLTEHGIVVEDWGGDTIAVPVSAKSGDGIVNLLEMILLQAEVLELKANPNRLALGTVIEARLDKSKGPVATLLVLNGTLKSGMSVVAGTCSGRIRAMTNYKGDAIRKAGPATAVEILGLTEVPEAGDQFYAVREDKMARTIAESRRFKLREEVMAKNSSITLEQLFTQIEEGEVKELNLIIKADVQGSVGALTTSLEKLKNENVVVKVIHSGVGTVTESDVMLASTSGAIIIGFNVRPSTAVSTMADRDGVEIRSYRIIYEAIEDIEAAMKGMLDPVFKEVVMGKIEIRETFKVPGAGMVGGAYVLEGKVQRNAQIRLVRDGIIVHEGKISSLRRFKDDVKEVNTGYECGIGIENYNDIKEGDIIEAFKMEEIERK